MAPTDEPPLRPGPGEASSEADDPAPSTLRSPDVARCGAESGPRPSPSPVPSHHAPSEPPAEVLPLRTRGAVDLTPARATVVAGGTIEIAASSPGLSALTWSIFPRDAGRIETIAREGARATFTAAASVVETTVVLVTAYGVDGGVGIGTARITIEPARR